MTRILTLLRRSGAYSHPQPAVELVARHYEFFVDQGQLATVLRWLDVLPEAVAAADWLLCFAGGVVSAHAGQLDQAERWLELAERAPPLVRDGQEPAGPLAALTGYLRLLRGDIDGTVVNARRALAVSPAAGPVWALAPQMVLAPALWWSGQAAEARVVLETVTRTAQAAGIPAAMVYALGMRAAIAVDEQDERTAEALAQEAIELMRRAELDEHPWAATAHIVNGVLLGRRGELAAAAEEVERGMALAERLRAWQTTAHASLALAEIRQRQQQPAAAQRLLKRVRDLLKSLRDAGDGFSRLEQVEKALRMRATSDRDTASAPFWQLSQREIEVLRLLPSQLSQREIAAELYVSFNTIGHIRARSSINSVSPHAPKLSLARANSVCSNTAHEPPVPPTSMLARTGAPFPESNANVANVVRDKHLGHDDLSVSFSPLLLT